MSVILGRLAAVLFAVLLTGCGASAPTSPTPIHTPTPTPAPAPAPTLVGGWGGTMRALFQGSNLTLAIRVDIQQANETLAGTWRVTTAGNDIRGDVRGQLTGGRFSGTATWSSDAARGSSRCAGTAPFTGSANPPQVLWESPQGWDFGGTCSDPPTQVTWSLVHD